jgi:hypothetical protein
MDKSNNCVTIRHEAGASTHHPLAMRGRSHDQNVDELVVRVSLVDLQVAVIVRIVQALARRATYT